MALNSDVQGFEQSERLELPNLMNAYNWKQMEKQTAASFC